MHTEPRATIEVFADVWCPFTHVGLREVAAMRQRLGRSDLVIRVRAWPLELVNGTGLDPIATRSHVEHLREQVAPQLFTNFRVDAFPTSTLEALALVERAYRRDVRAGERASFEVRDAMFEHGLDISDAEVVRSIGERLGIGAIEQVDRDAVVVDWNDGIARGVRGSPHFFCGDTDSFCPSLQITKDDQHLSIVRDSSRLIAFLAECMGAG